MVNRFPYPTHYPEVNSILNILLQEVQALLGH